MRRLMVLVVTTLMLFVVTAADVSADGDPDAETPDPAPSAEPSGDDTTDSGGGDSTGTGFTAGEDVNIDGDEPDAQVPRTASVAQAANVEPKADSDVTEDFPHAEDAAKDPGVVADNCVESLPAIYDADGALVASELCTKWRDCGAERIDDVVSGDIAGDDATGRYADYLGEMVTVLGGGSVAADPALDALLSNANSLSDILLSNGLRDRPDALAIAVFYWCAERDASFVYDRFEASSVSFGWDLTVDQVYDIPGSRDSLYIELTTTLDLFKPQANAVPPIERGFTIAQWPTWLFLDNTKTEEIIYTTNDVDTFRIDLRASLVRIDWTYGDTLITSCTADQMKTYDPDEHDPIDDLPECHHRFTQVDSQPLTTTITYLIEEKIRVRDSATLDDYPNIDWQPFQGFGPDTIELANTVDNYEVHEIVSVNVAD